MKQYVCSICGFIYDEAAGLPASGIAAGTTWEQLPGDWVCPVCKADKSAFREKTAAAAAAVTAEVPAFEKAYSDLEKSVICSNLARGCEKQFQQEEAALFRQLADFYQKRAGQVQEAGTEALAALLEEDLTKLFPYANAVSGEGPDRGALRALTWSEKVSRMIESLLKRYQTEGPAMLQKNNVYVCSVCGFIYVGDCPPELCPVCKVPAWKFEKVEGRGL